MENREAVVSGVPDKIVAGNIKDLLPNLNSKGFGPFDYAFSVGSAVQALTYGKVFCPDFLILEDMVFLASAVEDEDDVNRVLQYFQKVRGEKGLVEASFNITEITNLIGGRPGDGDEGVELLLARLLHESWTALLKAKFPERQFVVEIIGAAENDDETAITFYQSSA